jgi:hypothetical protein
MKLLKNRYDFIDLFGGGIEEHRPLTGFQPDRIDPEGGTDQPDNPLVYRFIPKLKVSDIALGNAYLFRKDRLGKVQGMAKCNDPLMDGFYRLHIL